MIFENNPTLCRFGPMGVVAVVVAVVKAGKRAVGGRSMDEEAGDVDIELGARVGARRLKRRSA